MDRDIEERSSRYHIHCSIIEIVCPFLSVMPITTSDGDVRFAPSSCGLPWWHTSIRLWEPFRSLLLQVLDAEHLSIESLSAVCHGE